MMADGVCLWLAGAFNQGRFRQVTQLLALFFAAAGEKQALLIFLPHHPADVDEPEQTAAGCRAVARLGSYLKRGPQPHWGGLPPAACSSHFSRDPRILLRPGGCRWIHSAKSNGPAKRFEKRRSLLYFWQGGAARA